MTELTTSEPVDMSYEPVSRELDYIELNRRFVESVDWASARRVVDLACGTGTVTDLVWRALAGVHGNDVASIVGIDLSGESLSHAHEHFRLDRDLAPALASGRVCFVEESADATSLPDGEADAVVMASAIHMFDDKERLFAEVRRILRPGGLFAFNSSFYAGTFVPGTERFYTEWMKQALAHIARVDAEERRAGRAGVRRQRGLAAPAFSKRWLSPDDFAQLFGRQGFEVETVNERTLVMTRSVIEKVGAYAGLASVLLSGYDVPLACEALERSVQPALAAVGASEVPRYWLEMVVVKQ